MRRWMLGAFFPAVILGLSGCSWLSPLGVEEDRKETAALAARQAKVPVVRVENLELGRLYDGYMLTAFATAPGVGYYQPELRPRFGGRPGPDGFLEYDFLVRPPENANSGTDVPITARLVRADWELTPVVLRSARGVRVWSERDSVEGRF